MRPSSAARFRGVVGRAWAGVGGGGLPPARAAPRPAAAPGPPAAAAEAATHLENELAHIHKTSDAQKQSMLSQIKELERQFEEASKGEGEGEAPKMNKNPR